MLDEHEEEEHVDVEQRKVTFQIHDYPDSDTDNHDDDHDKTRPYFTFSPVQGKQLFNAAHHTQADGAPDPLGCVRCLIETSNYIRLVDTFGCSRHA